jgi:hypothetical protein
MSFDELLETHNAHRSPDVRLERIRRLNDNQTPDQRFEDHQDPARRKKGEHTVSVSPMKTSQLFDSDDEDDDENEKDNKKEGAGANNNNNNDDASPGAS